MPDSRRNLRTCLTALAVCGTLSVGGVVAWWLLSEPDLARSDVATSAVDAPAMLGQLESRAHDAPSSRRNRITRTADASQPLRGPAAAPLSEIATGSVRLHVIDADTRLPIGGADVAVRDGTQARTLTTSAGPDGVAIVDEVPASRGALVRVVARGHAPVTIENVTVINGETTDLGDVKLEHGIGIRGRVRSEAGEPVPNAQVSLHRTRALKTTATFDLVAMYDEIWEPAKPVDATTSDETGSFWFAAVGNGDYTAEVRAAGFQVAFTAPFAVLQDVPPDPLDVVVQTGTLFKALVKNEAGLAVAGAEVLMLQSPRGLPFNMRTQKTATDGDGAFQFDTAPLEPFQIHIRAGGFAPYSNTEVVAKVDPVEFVLKRGATIQGRVYDVATSKGLGGVRVAAAVANKFQGFSSTISADDGSYTLKDVPAGNRVTLVAKRGGYALFPPLGDERNAFGTVGLEVEGVLPDSIATKDIPMAGNSVVTGRVIDGDSGAPIAGADVMLLRGGNARGIAQFQAPTTRSALDGTFTLMPAAAGAFRIYAWAPGYVLAPTDRKKTFEPNANDVAAMARVEPEATRKDVEVRLVRGTEIEVEVRDANGRGIPDVSLRWTDDAAPFELNVISEPYRQATMLTDASGHATLDGLPRSKRIRVDASRADFTAGGTATVDTDDGQLKRAEITITRGATIIGRVCKPDGRGAAGIPIRYVPRAGAPPAPRVVFGTRNDPYRAVSSANGSFVLEGIRQGDGRLELATSDPEGVTESAASPLASPEKWLLDAPSVHLPVSEGQEERITLYIVPSLAIEGRVLFPSRRPAAGLPVKLRGEGVLAAVSKEVKSDGGGGYRFGGLRPGRYRLSTEYIQKPPPNQKPPGRPRRFTAGRSELEAGTGSVDLVLVGR